MSLYSDDRRKRKWDNNDSSPSRPRRDDRDRDYDRDRERDRHETSSSRYDERHGSSSSHRDRDHRHGSDRRSASPPSRDSKKSSSRSEPLDPAAAAGIPPLSSFSDNVLTISRCCCQNQCQFKQSYSYSSYNSSEFR